MRCWFAPEKMKAGRKLHEQIDEALRLHDRLLLTLSQQSMSSEWVKTEDRQGSQTRGEGRQAGAVSCPAREFEALRDWECCDADTGKDSFVPQNF